MKDYFDTKRYQLISKIIVMQVILIPIFREITFLKRLFFLSTFILKQFPFFCISGRNLISGLKMTKLHICSQLEEKSAFSFISLATFISVSSFLCPL